MEQDKEENIEEVKQSFSIIVAWRTQGEGVIFGTIPTTAFVTDSDSTALEKAYEWKAQTMALYMTTGSFVAPSVDEFLIAIVNEKESVFEDSDPTNILLRMEEIINSED
jgi:hypothetical protein